MAIKYEDYYQTLGVSKNASQGEIKKAYRKLARQYHPDLNDTEEAKTKMKTINAAYDILGDEDKRAKYDQFGANYKPGQEFNPADFGDQFGGGESFSGGDFSSFFSQFFGGGGGGGNPFASQGRPPARRGSDQEASITISLYDAIKGVTKHVHLDAVSPNGQRVARSFDVKIPAGTTDGAKIKLAKQGNPGVRGGANGDLILTVKIARQAGYELIGHDVTMDLSIAPWQGALGDKVELQTLSGEFTLTIPPRTGSGGKLRLKGKGLPKRGSGAGDLYVRLKIVFKDQLDPAEIKLYQQLRSLAIGEKKDPDQATAAVDTSAAEDVSKSDESPS